MKTTLVNRIKNGLPYGLIFIVVGIYFYSQDENDLAITSFSIGAILILGFVIYKLKFEKKK